MKYLYFSITLLVMPNLAYSTTCEDLGLYALSLYGCPYYNPQVMTTVPLCQQEQWKHLAFLDDRCYEEVKQDDRCTSWDCPAPYDKIMREPISGKVKVIPGSRELVDWHYRAARSSYGVVMRQLSKKGKR